MEPDVEEIEGPRRLVRLAVAGLGRIGQLHAEHIAWRLGQVELVRVADIAAEVASRTGGKFGIAWSTSFDDVLNDPAVDGVVIATPTPLHAEMIEAAARAGKHVFCEKPVSLDRLGTVHAIQAARRAGVQLQIGFQRRFDPDYAEAAERIRRGDVGAVVLYRSSLRDMQPPSFDYLKDSGGLFVDSTIHEFDAARWMVGEIEEVTAFGGVPSDPRLREIEDIDTAVVLLRFGTGALGVLDNTRLAGYGYECSAEILGARACLRIARGQRTNIETLTPQQVAKDHVTTFIERFQTAYRNELAEFAEAIAGRREPAVTGADGLAALTLAQAAARSFRERRTVTLRHHTGEDGIVYEEAA